MKFFIIALLFWVSAGMAQSSTAKDKNLAASAPLLQEEEKPLHLAVASAPQSQNSTPWVTVLITLTALSLFAGASLVAVNHFKKKKFWGGSRKYLIEQLSYCPVGPKTGVSLLKVGSEFILVGVTPENVNFLSRLNDLEKQYQTESTVEREHFQTVVAQELKHIKQSVNL